MTTHYLKCWPEFFAPIVSGHKTFEMRREDRAQRYAVNDVFVLQEYVPDEGRLTGREVKLLVTYAYRGTGVEKGYACLAVKFLQEASI